MLVNAMRNQTYNEKGALTHRSTKSAVLDFFSNSGAMRHVSKDRILSLFIAAYNENPELARKALFYARDIRGGQGERRLFRICYRWLADNDPGVAGINLGLVPHYGRWDDLFSLIHLEINRTVVGYLYDQLTHDLDNMKIGRSVSLLAKWLPSINTSSKKKRALANYFAGQFFMTPRTYRKTLSSLRAYIDVVERKMSAGEWEDIKYQSVPSKAHKIYRRAFGRHDPEGYEAYLSAVERGEKDIKSGALFPYELVREYVRYARMRAACQVDRTIEAQWNALPNYVDDTNMLVVCDTSGSMFTHRSPAEIDVAVSLAIYAAERNTGIFHNAWINFSERPTMQYMEGHTLLEKVTSLDYQNWGNTTNLQGVFDLVLETAFRNDLSDDDLPRIIVIVSDMQFDAAVPLNNITNFQAIKDKYNRYGYTMPVLVFWNVRDTADSPVEMDETGTILISGASQSAFKYLMSADLDGLLELTPYNEMLRVLNSERYDPVV